MALRGWQVTCKECEWNVHAVHREHADAGRRAHEESTGHHDVVMYPAAEGNPAWGPSAGSDPPRKA